jgi:hypothetical protein
MGRALAIDGTSIRAFLIEPLQGKTSLTKIFWLYGVLGSLLLSAIGIVVDPGSKFVTGTYGVIGLLFSVYVTVATYRCADNCGSKILASFIRFSAVISLILIAIFAYLDFTGAVDQLLSTMGGEQ